MEQTIRGRDVRDAAGGERGGTPAGDYSTGVGGPAEWNRPEPGRAAQAISALAINMLIFVRFCLSNSQSVSTLMEKTHLRGHRLTTSPGRSEDPAEDGAGSDGPTGSRVCRAPQVRGHAARVAGRQAEPQEYRRINWRCSRPPGRLARQPRRQSPPRVRTIRITIPSQTQAQRLRRRTTVAGSRWPSISSANASCRI